MNPANALGIILTVGLPAVGQEPTVFEVEELAGGAPVQDVPAALDGSALVLSAGASLELAVPIPAGIARITIAVMAVGDEPAVLETLVEGEVGGQHFVPAGVWGDIGIGVESGEAGAEADIRLTAARGAVALDRVAVEKLEETHETLPLLSPGTLHRETPLVADGEAAATLLLPCMEEYRAVAEQFARRFTEATGVELPTIEESEATEEDLASDTCIMVGNLATGPLSLRLYARRLIYSDGAFPGDGGHELRTVHDPWGAGTNVVYLGGSDPEGCRAAAEALLDRLEPADGLTLPVIVDWQSEKTSFGPLTDEQIANIVQDLEDYLHSFSGAYQYKSAAGRPSSYARAYYLGGGETQAKAYAALVRVLKDYYEDTPGVDPPTFTLETIVAGLDQIEECEALSDEDRLMAEEWVRQIVEDSMDYWEMRDPIAREKAGIQAPTWNHQTHPAVGIAFAAEYFNAHFDLPAVDWWKRVVDNLFAGQETAYKPLEDSANYQWITMVHTMKWALISGDMDIFENGTIARTCELAIACHDNFGHEATFGDPWIEFGSNARTLMRIASLYYDDPRFRWLAQRLDANAGTEAVLGYYNWTGPTEEPREHVGLTTFILDPAVHERYLQGNAAGSDVPAERSLDKAVFRSGFTEQDSYLMLDGISAGIHDHDDANAIIRYTDNGRLWLCDMDYIRATPKWHNSILLSRDGQTTAVPGLSELVAEADFGNAGVVQARAPGYAWTDWTRSIFWDDEFFVVMDDVKALESGSFRATCVWRTLGDTSIEGNRLDVEQDGEFFHITNVDGSRLSLRETWDRGHGNDRGYYSAYPHAGKMTQVLHQDQQAHLEPGESIRFVNLFEAGGEAQPRMSLRIIAPDVVALFRDGEFHSVIGLGPWEHGEARIDAAMFAIDGGGGAFADLGEVDVPGLQRTGQGEDSVIQAPDEPGDRDRFLAWVESVAAAAQNPPAPVHLERPEFPRELEVAWRAELPSDVRCTDVWGISAPAQIAAGTDGGETVLLSADGDVLWTREAQGMVRAVRFIDIDGDGQPELLSGADDAKLRAYTLAGELLWEVEIQRYHGRSGSVASICAAQLDDDPAHEVVIGSDNWHHYGFDGDGTELWRTNTTHASTVCDAGDIDGDGYDEVLAGSEYYGSKVLDQDGHIMASVGGGPNWPACLVTDLDGDATAEVLFGADDAVIRARGGDNEELWEANVGGSVTAIIGLSPTDAGAVVAASSEAGSVYGFDGAGAMLWRTELPEQVSDLVTLNTQLAAACDDGTVYLLGADGGILGGYRPAVVDDADAPVRIPFPGALSAGDLHGAGSAVIVAAWGAELLALAVD